jgi:hypothetical protein
MQTDNLQLQRFELKYVVSEQTALMARDFVRSYLTLDQFSVGKPNLSYPVHSLYVDSNDLILYQRTISGEKNRYKLRVRFYDDNSSSPAFLEIKRRTDQAILKQRCPVSRRAVADVFNGHMPVTSEILSSHPRHYSALQKFIQLTFENHARPTGHVAYLREAWISRDDNSVRVTMDRDVRFDPEPTARLFTQMKSPVWVFQNQVVLELKFTGRFPVWFNEMTRALNLTQRSAAKYADGIELFGENRLRQINRLQNSGLRTLDEWKEVA